MKIQARVMLLLTTIIFMSVTTRVFAYSWKDLWYTQDQQAAQLFKQGNAREAAPLFKNPEWAGVAYYRSGKYPEAIESWSQHETELNLYNRSLAYARVADYDAAIADLKRVIAMNPANEKAKDNLRALENLKNQQKKMQNNGNSVQNGKQSKSQRATQETQKKRKGQERAENAKQQDVDEAPTPQPSDQDKAKSPSNAKDGQNPPNSPGQSRASREREQAKQQALRRIPDDVGGLLREKFLRDYRRRHEI